MDIESAVRDPSYFEGIPTPLSSIPSSFSFKPRWISDSFKMGMITRMSTIQTPNQSIMGLIFLSLILHFLHLLAAQPLCEVLLLPF
jgi:hypothetical protein